MAARGIPGWERVDALASSLGSSSQASKIQQLYNGLLKFDKKPFTFNCSSPPQAYERKVRTLKAATVGPGRGHLSLSNRSACTLHLTPSLPHSPVKPHNSFHHWSHLFFPSQRRQRGRPGWKPTTSQPSASQPAASSYAVSQTTKWLRRKAEGATRPGKSPAAGCAAGLWHHPTTPCFVGNATALTGQISRANWLAQRRAEAATKVAVKAET